MSKLWSVEDFWFSHWKNFLTKFWNVIKRPCRLHACLSVSSGIFCHPRNRPWKLQSISSSSPRPAGISALAAQVVSQSHTAGSWGRGGNPSALPLHSYLGINMIAWWGEKVKTALLVLVSLETKQAQALFLFAQDQPVSHLQGLLLWTCNSQPSICSLTASSWRH